ncbi:MAG: L,D-transpeptidase, partial [Acidimicrobiia bacterium]|nr:L,D-transpeptidase [Acidimicrobiia bacterium]
VPNYPASHGCVRVTTTAMDFIWANDLIPLRMPVWVHGG